VNHSEPQAPINVFDFYQDAHPAKASHLNYGVIKGGKMLIFELSEVIAILVIFFLGITTLFMIPQWVPAALAERAPEFVWEMRAGGLLLIVVALMLLHELYDQLVGFMRLG
jgi:hypothetical protein